MPSITITRDDLAEVVERVLPFRDTEPDSQVLRAISVRPGEDGLRWVATDTYRMACLYRGESDLDSPVVIPAELVDFATRHANRADLETITFTVDLDDQLVTLVQPALHVPRELVEAEYLDVDRYLFGAPDHRPTVLRLSGEDLRAAVHASVTFTSSTSDTSDHPIALRTVNEDTLQVVAQWPDVPDTQAFLPVSADGPIDTLVNAQYLHDLLDAAGARDLEIVVGSMSEPLRVRTEDGFYGFLMPVTVGQPYLESRLASFLGIDESDLVVRANGWIPIHLGDIELTVRLVASTDPFGRGNLARFVAVVAESIRETPDLLRELNHLNGNAVQCRLLHDGSTVYVAAETLLETLDDEEIESIAWQLVRQAETFGPLITALHRDEAPDLGSQDSDEERTQQSRTQHPSPPEQTTEEGEKGGEAVG